MRPGIIWEGPSPLDGAPLVAIATHTTNRKAANVKTGPMVQVYILRADISPLEAVKSGQDTSICGYCPMRGNTTFKRSCYVNVGQAPVTVWNTCKAGKYSPLDFSTVELAGYGIRWGAYGDPAMLPEEVVDNWDGVVDFSLGYTHQWRSEWASWTRGVFMASVETQEQEALARSRGWATFRAGLRDGSDIGDAILCRNERDGSSCDACRECDGKPKSIYIPAHGFGAINIPAERLIRSKK